MTRADTKGIHKRWIEDDNRAKKKDLIHKVVIVTLAFIGIIGIVTFTPNPFAFEEQQSIDVSLDYQANEQHTNERITLMESILKKKGLETGSAAKSDIGGGRSAPRVRFNETINSDEQITLSKESGDIGADDTGESNLQWKQLMEELTDKAYRIGRNFKNEHDDRQEIEDMYRTKSEEVKNQEDKHDWYHLLLTWFKGRAFYCGQTYGASKKDQKEQIGLLLFHIGLKVNCNNYWEKHLIKEKLSKYYQYGVDAKEFVDRAFLFGTKNRHEDPFFDRESENYYVKRLLKEGIDKNYWQKKSDLYEEMETKLRAAYQDGNKARK